MAYQNVYIDTHNDETVVYVWDDNNQLLTYPWSQFAYAYTEHPSGTFKSMDGKRLNKVYGNFRNRGGFYETDLPRETRVLTDLYLNEDEPSTGNVVLFFDIEVSMEDGLPNVKTATNEITSIAVYDPTISKYSVFVLDKSELYTNRMVDGTDIIFCKSEIELLHKFIDLYEEIRPTIITGWNSNGFDVPYLYNRLVSVCGRSTANRLSPIGKVKYSERLEQYKIAGVSSLDYFDLYKKFTYTQQANYRLDTIGRIEVGMGKVPYEGSLDQLFRENLETFIEYNLQDVRIIVELDKKLKLIELVRGICHLGHVPYEDYGMSSRFLEGTIVTYLHRKGIIVPNKPQDGREKMQALDDGEEGFTGAYVKDPVPGLYEWIYSLDLQSLYPSIIMSLNISPETKAGFVKDWNPNKHIANELSTYVVELKDTGKQVTLNRETFMEFMKEQQLSLSSNGVLYTNHRVGIIPEILDIWFKQRVEYKNTMKQHVNNGNKELAEYYDRRQHIQKIFLNSLYGVLGLPVFRFYDVDNAAAVTLTGQDVIKSSASFVNDLYKSRNVVSPTGSDDHCVYIDTDSLYFSSMPFLGKFTTHEEKLEFTIKLARTVESLLNKNYDVIARDMFFCSSHRLYIKGESIATTGLWTVKKRYALNKTYDLETNKIVNNKIVAKGLDVVRSSFPKAFREFMNQLLADILNKVDKRIIDENILEFKNKLETTHYLEIARNTSANNISEYSAGLAKAGSFATGTPAHVKASISYNRLLQHFNIADKYAPIEDGEKIKYVFLKKNPLHIDTLAVKGYGDPSQITNLIEQYIDIDALFDKELKNKLEQIYTALRWGNLPTNVNQNASTFFDF